MIVWRLLDGKPGHEKQTLGLANALARLVPCRVLEVRLATGGRFASLRSVFDRYKLASLPAPDLILAAGRRTHLLLLTIRQRFGGRAVVCMRPGMPCRWFDLCLIPRHDRPAPAPNVIATWGALTSVVPGGAHAPGKGLIVLGGESRHFAWSTDAIMRQIGALIAATPQVRWVITTSRRTPPACTTRLLALEAEVQPYAATPSGWLERELAAAGWAWVTPDSVSMVYEALTSGCRTGVFDLPATLGSRVASGLEELLATGRVARHFAQPVGPQALDEGTRCARLILQRWWP